VTANADGAVVTANADGAVVTANADGAVVTANADGAVVTANADGAVVTGAAAVVQAPLVGRSAWRRVRVWVVLAAIALLGAAVVTSLSRGGSSGDLDPNSAQPSGSKALAQVLAHYGIRVERVTSADDAAAADAGAGVVVVAPDDYSAAQLQRIGALAGRVVLMAPGDAALRALAPGVTAGVSRSGPTDPACRLPGALATGPVDLPAPTSTYLAGATDATCYGGALIVAGRVAIVGSQDLLRNDTLDGAGIAALDVNTISADRTLTRVLWLMPGSGGGATAARSVWQLFPGGAHRAFVWLIVLGVLLVLWRARRLGPVVTEPLPVVVRSAEVVEGHGRLYRRAGARDRAAAALRGGTAHRLSPHLGLHRRTPLPRLAEATALRCGRTPDDVLTLLGGAAPPDDAALLRLAGELDALESAAGVPPRSERGPRD
jgi:hypothetical protein